MREENIKTAEAFLNALRMRDLSLAPFADELEFEDPIAGKGIGAENFKAFLEGFLVTINGVKTLQHVCEDDYVVTHLELDTLFGKISILEKFRIQNGKIVETIAYYDPRPILGEAV